MNNTNQIRQLLQRKIIAARNAANKTKNFMVPLEDRYIISMSIWELKQILVLLPRETRDSTGQIDSSGPGRRRNV